MKYDKFVKGITICVVLTIFIILIVCSAFGNEIYQFITPKVPVKKTSTVNYGKDEYIRIPKQAVIHGSKIYYVVSEEGFSRTIYRVYCKEIVYKEDAYVPDIVLISTKLPLGCYVVTVPEKAIDLPDGSKVLPVK